MTIPPPNAAPDGAARRETGGDPAGPAPAAPPSSPRRRLLTRVTLGLLLAGGTLGLLVWDHYGGCRLGLTLLLTAATGLALHEFYGIVRQKGLRPASRLAIAFAVFLTLVKGASPFRAFEAVGLKKADEVLAFLGSGFPPESLFLIGLLVLLTGFVAARDRRSPEDLFATVFGIVYVWLPLYLLFEIVADVIHPRGKVSTLPGIGETTLILLLVTNKVSDSAAYLCGTFFGRHPMAPSISPKKTWEGAAAGLLFGTAAGVAALKLMMPEMSLSAGAWAGAVFFSALLAAAGQLGDLVESVVKRWAGVKDSGRVAPEFGGALDMIDGFLVSIPVAYLFLAYGGERWVFSGF